MKGHEWPKTQTYSDVDHRYIDRHRMKRTNKNLNHLIVRCFLRSVEESQDCNSNTNSNRNSSSNSNSNSSSNSNY